jgi:uncharacterized protein YbjQ (UPF0145 family)
VTAQPSQRAFTSDLTIDELLLVEEVGFEPVELVLGTSYFHTGWAPSAWSQNMELTQISAMMLGARRTAMDRMLAHAQALGADGIVGMRIDMEREGHHSEFTAFGTAVRRRDGKGAAWRDRHGRPFTCDLSGEDFWGLVRGGFRPLALCHGVCVYHVAHKTLGQWFSSLSQTTSNMEQPQFTQALYDAREIAMARIQADATDVGGEGLVGVEIRESSHGWEAHIMEFVGVGTAITPIRDATHEVHEPPKVVMFTDDDAAPPWP